MKEKRFVDNYFNYKEPNFKPRQEALPAVIILIILFGLLMSAIFIWILDSLCKYQIFDLPILKSINQLLPNNPPFITPLLMSHILVVGIIALYLYIFFVLKRKAFILEFQNFLQTGLIIADADFFVALNKDGEIVYSNDNFYNLFDDGNHHIGKNFIDYLASFSGLKKEGLDQIKKSLKTKIKTKVPITVKKKEYDFRCFPVKNPPGLFVLKGFLKTND